jgi:hypothetical protein
LKEEVLQEVQRDPSGIRGDEILSGGASHRSDDGHEG